MNYKVESVNTEQAELLNAGKLLPVMEDFYTIQGEGFNSGKPAYFVRVGGCDVGCHWCDVKESWDASLHPLVKADDVVRKVLESKSKAVVITGGEPLQYNMDYITEQFKSKNIEIFIETSGAYPLTGNWDWICLSPKKTMNPLPEVYTKANELKVIVYNKNDFDWALEQAKKVNKNCLLFLQPEWSKSNQMMPLIVEFVKEHQNWMVSLQSHKYMNIP
ncbi:MAG TPA: 7-carboxy-7-deazaguanine synthase QueE [Bacteroidia bacterium]|nr:7-carboxy-7-deazaguanine synthase QueE [Bacteroidia bacterium]